MDLMKSNRCKILLSRNHTFANLDYNTDKITTTHSEDECDIELQILDTQGKPTNTVRLKIK